MLDIIERADDRLWSSNSIVYDGIKLDKFLKNISPVILYEGSSSGTIKLSQSAANFKRIKVFYHVDGGNNLCGFVEVINPNKKAVTCIVNYPDRQWNNHFYGALKVFNDYNLETFDYGRFSYGGNGGLLADDNAIIIDRVEGYNY